MKNLIGKTFFGGMLVVTAEAAAAALRWFHYHRMCRFAASEEDAELRNISEACCEDEYKEMKANAQVMGVGLYIYNQCA